MLFNSIEFLVLFLPFVVLGCLCLNKLSILLNFNKKFYYHLFLIFVSFVFYSFFSIKYLFLLIFSILVNFFISYCLEKKKSFILLIFGIIFNLSIILYYKYLNFILINLGLEAQNFNSNFNFDYVFIPLAISFYTFQQIGYLVDIYKGNTKIPKVFEYFVFVSFFPQLIAGPILRGSYFFPQLQKTPDLKFDKIEIGLCIFFIGLFKKVCIADQLGKIVNPIFFDVENGKSIDFITSWVGGIAYSLQLYFDFSSYSEMAVGLGIILGFTLPLNFNSPYKQTNIIQFWRNWHITLHNFFKEYVYIPLGGSKNSLLTTVILTNFVFLIGGLWHGAGWNFIVWGLYNGILVSCNLLIKYCLDFQFIKKNFFVYFLKRLFLLIFLVVGWIFFRSSTLDVASTFLGKMFDLKLFYKIFLDFYADQNFILNLEILKQYCDLESIILILLSAFIVLFLPNWHDIFLKKEDQQFKNYNLIKLNYFNNQRNQFVCKTLCVLLFLISFYNLSDSPKEFIYFQF